MKTAPTVLVTKWLMAQTSSVQSIVARGWLKGLYFGSWVLCAKQNMVQTLWIDKDLSIRPVIGQKTLNHHHKWLSVLCANLMTLLIEGAYQSPCRAFLCSFSMWLLFGAITIKNYTNVRELRYNVGENPNNHQCTQIGAHLLWDFLGRNGKSSNQPIFPSNWIPIT